MSETWSKPRKIFAVVGALAVGFGITASLGGDYITGAFCLSLGAFQLATAFRRPDE